MLCQPSRQKLPRTAGHAGQIRKHCSGENINNWPEGHLIDTYPEIGAVQDHQSEGNQPSLLTGAPGSTVAKANGLVSEIHVP